MQCKDLSISSFVDSLNKMFVWMIVYIILLVDSVSPSCEKNGFFLYNSLTAS